MKGFRVVAWAVVGVGLPVLVGCGGGAAPAAATPQPTPVAGPRTETYSGTSTFTTNSCSSVRHSFEAGAGSVTVTVTQASANPIGIQLCPTGSVNHAADCTIPPFASVAVGAALTAPLKGGRSQFVNVVPDACGRPGTFPAATVSYTLTVTYPG